MKVRIALILLGTVMIPFLVNGQDSGSITVQSKEAGLSVFLNGQKAGDTPLTAYPLVPGTYRLIVHRGPLCVWNDAHFEKDVLIEAGRSTEVFVELPTVYLFDSTPFGADVELNGVHIGKTPLHFKGDQPLEGSVLFKKNGYSDRTLPIEAGSAFTHGDLTIKPNFRNKLNENLNLEKEKSVDRRLLYSTLVLGTLSGAAAAYFKIEADQAARKTERAADLGDLNGVEKYSDRTDRYDTYSAVGFGIMQINFIGLIYAVLR